MIRCPFDRKDCQDFIQFLTHLGSCFRGESKYLYINLQKQTFYLNSADAPIDDQQQLQKLKINKNSLSKILEQLQKNIDQYQENNLQEINQQDVQIQTKTQHERQFSELFINSQSKLMNKFTLKYISFQNPQNFIQKHNLEFNSKTWNKICKQLNTEIMEDELQLIEELKFFEDIKTKIKSNILICNYDNKTYLILEYGLKYFSTKLFNQFKYGGNAGLFVFNPKNDKKPKQTQLQQYLLEQKLTQKYQEDIQQQLQQKTILEENINNKKLIINKLQNQGIIQFKKVVVAQQQKLENQLRQYLQKIEQFDQLQDVIVKEFIEKNWDKLEQNILKKQFEEFQQKIQIVLEHQISNKQHYQDQIKTQKQMIKDLKAKLKESKGENAVKRQINKNQYIEKKKGLKEYIEFAKCDICNNFQDRIVISCGHPQQVCKSCLNQKPYLQNKIQSKNQEYYKCDCCNKVNIFELNLFNNQFNLKYNFFFNSLEYL